jgi:hypothetical protein
MTSTPEKEVPEEAIVTPRGAELDDLRQAAEQYLCTGPIGDPRDVEVFFLSILKYMQRWYEGRWDDPPLGFSAFIFSTRPRRDAQEKVPGAERIHVFSTNPNRPLAGRAFITASGLEDVRGWGVEGESLSDFAKLLDEKGFGSYAAVLLNLRERKVWLFPEGVETEARWAEWEIKPVVRQIGADAVDELLTGFAKAFLNPNADQALRVWHSPADGVPVSRTEEKIQKYLLMHARGVFGDCVAIPEAPTAAGRADLLIKRGDAAGGVLLELKVLRSRSFSQDAKKASGYSQAQIDTHVVDGIDQAADYRDELRATEAFLCCYDMRDADEDLAEQICLLAKTRVVHLRRYYIERVALTMRRNRPNSAYRKWTALRQGKPD